VIKSLDDSKSATTAATAAVEIAMDMAPQRQYRLAAKGNLWFRIVAAGAAGGAAAAVAGDGSHYLADGKEIDVAIIGPRNRISIIRDTTDVVACLSCKISVVQ
jgi:hypothetical protein